MKFYVNRTSEWGDNQPCPQATLEPYVRVDRRTADDPKKIPMYHGTDGDWYKEGRNHRVENGQIARDFDDKAWFVEIDTLDALVAFAKEHGQLVLAHEDWPTDGPSIEIYDGYRE